MKFCRCKPPSPQVVEGFEVCAECGDRVPDRLMLLIVKQQREILERIRGLEEGSEETTPGRLLGPAQLAKQSGSLRNGSVSIGGSSVGAASVTDRGPDTSLTWSGPVNDSTLTGTNGATPSSPSVKAPASTCAQRRRTTPGQAALNQRRVDPDSDSQ